MQDFLINLSSPSWWLGVVVVGILINMISPYLNNGLEKTLIKISSNFKRKTAERLEKRNRKIAQLRTDQHQQIMFAFKELRLRTRALYGVVEGLMLVVFGFSFTLLNGLSVKSIAASVFSSLCIFFGLSRMIISLNDIRKVIEIRDILNEVTPDTADSDIVDWL